MIIIDTVQNIWLLFLLFLIFTIACASFAKIMKKNKLINEKNIKTILRYINDLPSLENKFCGLTSIVLDLANHKIDLIDRPQYAGHFAPFWTAFFTAKTTNSMLLYNFKVRFKKYGD